jgi:hypothetical protein
MPIDVQRTLDFGGARKIVNLPAPTQAGDAANKAYVDSAVEGLAWKDSCRVATQSNISIASPGATVDGITMVSGDRVLVRAQTTGAENGIFVWNGAAVAMSRALDANTAEELEQAVVTVEEGTSAGVTFRQGVVNATLGTTALTWSTFGASVPLATASTAGTVTLATKAEADAGADTAKAITPATLASSVWASRKFAATIGDGSATSYTVNHNLGSRDVVVEVYRNSGNFDSVLVEVQRTTVNALTLLFDAPPAANAYRVVVRT